MQRDAGKSLEDFLVCFVTHCLLTLTVNGFKMLLMEAATVRETFYLQREKIIKEHLILKNDVKRRKGQQSYAFQAR